MSEEAVDLTAMVEGGGGISTVRGSDTFRGWNNIR